MTENAGIQEEQGKILDVRNQRNDRCDMLQMKQSSMAQIAAFQSLEPGHSAHVSTTPKSSARQPAKEIQRVSTPLSEVLTPLVTTSRINKPIFISKGIEGWISNMERYFQVNRVEEAARLESAMNCLEGAALQ